MSMTLMHVEYHPTNVTHPTAEFRRIADWLNERLKTDQRLDPAERADPKSVNLLWNIVEDTEGPMTTDAAAVRRFQKIVERNTRGNDDETAVAAREIADRMAELAEEHDPLHFALL